MIELYHAPISSCSQKVRLVLEEKGLEWKGHLLDLMRGDQHDAEYRKLNPAGVVPTLVVDGTVFVESTLINEFLDDAYPEPSLRPPSAADRHTMRAWTKLIDDRVHPACGVLTYAIGARPALLLRPRDEVLAVMEQIPDRRRREARRSVYEEGVHSPEVPRALAAHVAFLDRMETALTANDWLAGDRFSLADAAALPYVLRLDHLALSHLWENGTRSRVAAWLDRVRDRRSYRTAVLDFLPEAMVNGMRKGAAAVGDEIREILAD